VFTLHQVCWGGGGGGLQWGRAPLWECLGEVALKNKFSLVFMSIFGRSSVLVSIYGKFFSTWFFVDCFLFLVKELGFLTNPGHWIRVLDVVGSYMHIVF
jgi:hypothetical protein